MLFNSNKPTEELLTNAGLILVIIDGELKIVKNRNMITRSDLIEILEAL